MRTSTLTIALILFSFTLANGAEQTLDTAITPTDKPIQLFDGKLGHSFKPS